MLEVTVEAIQVSLISPHRIVLLKEVERERYLPIWIGACESEAIAMRLQGITPPRPLSHDLMLNLIRELGASLEFVVVTALRNDTFYARLALTRDEEPLFLDCRPSDAIALAVRAEVPIYVEDEVMQEVGLTPDGDLLGGNGSAEDEELEIFRRFLDRLDLDDLPTD